jgi:HSP20 family protein
MMNRPLSKHGEFFPALSDFFSPFNDWFEKGGHFLGKEMTVPLVNVAENPKDYTISLAAPGMKKEDFNIDVDGNILSVSAEIDSEKEEREAKYTRKEYNFSSFTRSFTLPDSVNKDKIEASYENGILKLMLPKTEVTKISAKHIDIK